MCVDVHSRKGYAIPMKNKNTLNVTDAFKKFLLLCKPKKIMCDIDGSGFISKNFDAIGKQKILTLIMLMLVII